MKNHLFIGLGGFGGQTLREIRKCEFLNKEYVEKKRREGVQFNVDFLYCDSSDDIRENTVSWKVLGEDVSLEPRDFINLRQQGVTFDNVDSIPNLKNWIGSRASIDKYLTGLGSQHGANQRRRFGRFLFANNADKFLSKVQNKVSMLGTNECAFHIFATFAGGTGSGALIDAIAIIRNEFKDDKDFPIFVYGYATDRNKDSAADVGYFYPNQYSVIRDLNALMIGSYRPQVLTENQVVKADPNLKHVDAVYLITPENRNKVNFEPKEQIKIVGNWAYQRVMSEVFGYIDPKVRKAFTGEDYLHAFLGEMDEQTKKISRGVRFGSIGLIRWRIPEEETREALMCDYLIQAYSQMVYNKWDSDSGYITTGENPSENNDGMLIEFGLGSMQDWNLSKVESHKTYESEWTGVADSFDYNPSKDLKSNLRELVGEFEDYSRQKFRGTGVDSYYSARVNAGLHQEVERFENFLRDWTNKKWIHGAHGVKGIIAQLESLLSTLDGQMGVIKKEAEIAPQPVSKIEKKWKTHAEKPGLLARQFGIEKKMYGKAAEQIVKSYVDACKQKGGAYGVKLCEAMQESVTSTIQAINKSEARLMEILEHFKSARRDLLNYENLAVDSHALGRDLIEFDKESYANVWNVMRKNKNQVDSVASECRGQILTSHRFLTTLHSLKKDSIVSVSERAAESHVKPGHDKACEKDPNLMGKEVIGKNIWEVLKGYNTSELSGKIEGFIKSSVTLGKRSKDKFRHDTLSLPLEHILVLNPKYTDTHIESLREKFVSKDGQDALEFVEHDNPSEILCLSVDAAAPARLFNVVHELERKYNEKIKTEDGKYFVHLDFETEDPMGLPSVLENGLS